MSNCDNNTLKEIFHVKIGGEQMGKISKQTFIVEVATDKDSFEDWLAEKCSEIYNMAIDDFVETIDEEDRDECLVDDMRRIVELAEKVKGSRE